MAYKQMLCYFLLMTLANALPRPKYIKFCPKTDSNYTDCVIKAGQEVINNIKNGDRKYGIPNLNPLILPLVEVTNENNFKLNFNNLEVRGLGDAVIKDIDIKDKEIKIVLFFDKLRFTGTYHASGKLLIIPIEGNGPCNITSVEVATTHVCILEPYEDKDKLTYAKVIAKSNDFELKRNYFDLKNLFNGDKKLGDHINNFMNENWEEVVKDLKPSINKIMIEIVTSVIGNFFKKIPYNELFP